MFYRFLAALICVTIQLTSPHFIGNLDECILAKICNHTWTPNCGHYEANSNYRLFLDECDMHEYNCDNTVAYKQVPVEECNGRCTQKDGHQLPLTSAMSTSTATTKSDAATKEPEVNINNSTTTLEVTDTTTDISDTSTIFVAPTTTDVTTAQVPEKTTDKTSVIYSNPDISPYFNDSLKTTQKQTLTCYPEQCSVPSTWETTSIGETRDFIQILRDRYGDKLKILRPTTHFPKKINSYVRRSDSFVPGLHKESS